MVRLITKQMLKQNPQRTVKFQIIIYIYLFDIFTNQCTYYTEVIHQKFEHVIPNFPYHLSYWKKHHLIFISLKY